jgi:broad specificity phosphatase PhoE
MNHLARLNRLKNRYFIIRHGESRANAKEIILSHPRSGVGAFGLTGKGKNQVLESARKNNVLDKGTIICSSDFKRASETAEIVRKVLKAKPIHLSKKLRERWFGEWERTHDSNYNRVWVDDAVDPDHKNKKVESTNEVLDRTTSLVLELEKKYSGKKIVLVAHRDALQILQAGFMKQSPSMHRKMKHLEVAEIRELKLKKIEK